MISPFPLSFPTPINNFSQYSTNNLVRDSLRNFTQLFYIFIFRLCCTSGDLFSVYFLFHYTCFCILPFYTVSTQSKPGVHVFTLLLIIYTSFIWYLINSVRPPPDLGSILSSFLNLTDSQILTIISREPFYFSFPFYYTILILHMRKHSLP